MKDEIGEVAALADQTFRVGSAQQGRGFFYSGFGKRAFDLVFAAVALAAVSPVIAVLWLLVKTDGGQGFFGHQRVTRGGRVFRCWKLRSMIPNAEAALQEHLRSNPEAALEWANTQKLVNDPRVTRIGRILRKTRLDELPQFWNVLIGEMSVVGPRPVTQMETLRFGEQSHLILSMMPGVTGSWQVSGRGDISYEERIAMDAAYYRDMTFAYDIKIIAKTVLTVFRMTGS